MSTYLSYRSPIRTFQELGISTENVDATQLRLERKRLLLEIQISDRQTTTIGEKEFGKNDIIELFDELEGISNFDSHLTIFEHPVLLHLLETQKISEKIKSEAKIHFDTTEKRDDFKAFISPYLAFSIDKLLTRVIRTNAFKDLLEIRSYFELLTAADAFFAFRKFNNFCETLSDRLQNLTHNHTTFPADEVAYLSQESFYDAVNELRVHYPIITDHVASAVINFTVHYERAIGRGKKLVQISDQARRLHCSAKLKSLIVNNRKAFYDSRENISNQHPGQVWRVLVGVLIVVSLMFRYSNSCDSKNKYNYLQENQELLEQLRQNSNLGPSNPGKSDIDEASFLALHSKFQSTVESKSFDQNFYLPDPEPKIIANFIIDDSTELKLRFAKNYTLKNKTKSDLLMIAWEGSTLKSYYIAARNSIDVKLRDNSSLFFYAGTDWDPKRMIQHMHRSPKTGIISIIRTEGYFASTSEKELQFLRKFFTLTDGYSVEFVVVEDKDGYQLFQGDRHVNYSY